MGKKKNQELTDKELDNAAGGAGIQPALPKRPTRPVPELKPPVDVRPNRPGPDPLAPGKVIK